MTAPLCSLCPFSMSVLGKASRQSGEILVVSGKSDNPNCRPGCLTSAPFSLLHVQCLQLPTPTTPRRPGRTKQSTSSNSGCQLTGQCRGLGVKRFYFKCLLTWQLQGTKNPTWCTLREKAVCTALRQRVLWGVKEKNREFGN